MRRMFLGPVSLGQGFSQREVKTECAADVSYFKSGGRSAVVGQKWCFAKGAIEHTSARGLEQLSGSVCVSS